MLALIVMCRARTNSSITSILYTYNQLAISLRLSAMFVFTHTKVIYPYGVRLAEIILCYVYMKMNRGRLWYSWLRMEVNL